MAGRISSVGHIRITDVGAPGALEIGDSKQIAPLNHAIAVQRQKAIFFQNEFLFRDYAIFFRPAVQAIPDENIKVITINESPAINVRNIELFSVSAAGVVHIGSSETLRADSRIKHIRHLLRERP